MAITSPPGRAEPAASDARQAKTDLLNQLAEGVLALTSSTAWANWLMTSRQFHRYSFQNQILILKQRPEATWVAGAGYAWAATSARASERSGSWRPA